MAEYRQVNEKPGVIQKSCWRNISWLLKNSLREICQFHSGTRALRLVFSGPALAHNNPGSDYLRKSDFSTAKNEFQQAGQLNQSDGGPRSNLTNVCILTGELSQAQLSLIQGMQRQPNSALRHFLQGTLDIRLGRLPQAESALRRAMQLNPMMAQARLQLVNLLLQQGRKEETVVQLQDFVAAFPESPFSGKVKDLLKGLEGPAPED
jgi:Flp pilus assembly protein TadD